MNLDKQLDEILGQFAGATSVAWDKNAVFDTDKVIKEQAYTKQQIEQLILEARIDGWDALIATLEIVAEPDTRFDNARDKAKHWVKQAKKQRAELNNQIKGVTQDE